MRLFIAINFDTEILKAIANVQHRLRQFGKGSFPRQENLHLTLAFLGEVGADRLAGVKSIMDKLTFRKFQLLFSHVGNFPRGDEFIYWLGIDQSQALIQLHDKLTKALADEGFRTDNRRFSPHITLARRMKLDSVPNSLSLLEAPFETSVNTIDLMCSHRINGLLTYSKEYEVVGYDIF